MPLLSLAAPGPPCLEALQRALAEVRGGDVLAPATVLVPGAVPALQVRRALGRLGGVAAVDVITVGRLAERLSGAAGGAAGTRPLPPGGWEEAVRVALAGDPGPFRAVAHHPATVARVASALRRLRPATPPERAALAAGSGGPLGRAGPARHLVRLLAAVEQLTSGSTDRSAVLSAAQRALDAGADPGPVVSFCPDGGDPAEVDLLAVLAATGRLRVVAAVTGDPVADDPVRRLADRIDPDAARPPVGPPPQPTRLVLASDAEAEARLVVQHVVTALESGLAGNAVAIVTLGGPAGLSRLSDLLDAAGVPWSGPADRTLAATPSGRALLGLLGLDREGWTHAGLLAALAAAPLRRSPDRPEPMRLGRWGALARQANVVAGADQWHDRPAARAAEARRRGSEALAAELEDLAAFAAELRTLLAPPPEPTWTSLAAWAVAVLDHVVDPATGPPPWPDAQVTDARAVRAVAVGLAALDDVADGPTRRPLGPADLVDALAARLGSTPARRRGRVGHGVLVATDPVDLVGATPDLLLLSGVVEGAAPARRVADPLVADADIQLVGAAPSRAVRRAAAHAAVLGALAAAGHSVAFAHRADGQSVRRPSRWFLGWAAALAGAPAPLGADDLVPAAGEWLTVVPSFAATACGPAAGSAQERRLAALDATVGSGTAPDDLASVPVVAAHPALRRAIAAAAARRSRRFTAWDGLVAAGLALDAETSASALEDWATCPQRYLLRHVLSVAATDTPGDALGVDGGDRGTLAHEVLAAVVRRGIGRPPDQAWDDDDRAFLGNELRRRADGLRRQGRLGRGVLADLRIDELHASLLAALDLDDGDRAEEGWVPDDVERSFGEHHGRPVAVALPSGRTIRFRGRIDRVDAAGDRRVRVVDYKTGRGTAQLEAAAGGAAAARLLQLGVYEVAAAAERPDAAVSSGWWLLEASRDGRPVPIVPNHLGPDRFVGALEAIAAGIEGGVFPADPGEDGYRGPENCRFCAFDRVCRADRVRALHRKAADPALEPWRALHEVGRAVAADEIEEPA